MKTLDIIVFSLAVFLGAMSVYSFGQWEMMTVNNRVKLICGVCRKRSKRIIPNMGELPFCPKCNVPFLYDGIYQSLLTRLIKCLTKLKRLKR